MDVSLLYTLLLFKNTVFRVFVAKWNQTVHQTRLKWFNTFKKNIWTG